MLFFRLFFAQPVEKHSGCVFLCTLCSLAFSPLAAVPYSQQVPPYGLNTEDARSGPPGELDLIHRIRARAAVRATGGVRLGIGDDCALLRLRPGEELAVTTDLSIEGRHFRLQSHPPEAIGHRTLARGLSDLAAMGAHPLAAFLSLALPRQLLQNTKMRSPASQRRKTAAEKPEIASWVDRYLDGFFALAEATGTPLAGGDLAQSSLCAADIVLLGTVGRDRALRRSGARPGDLIYVTGALGGAAAALAMLTQWGEKRRSRTATVPQHLAAALGPHLAPQPRLAVGQALVSRRLASAAIDISDGLSTDLAHVCEESRVAAEIHGAALPIHAAATLEQALHGGEDYELLFTAPPAVRIPQSIAGVAITQIGRILPVRGGRPAITLVTQDGPAALPARGWEHFA